MHLTQFSFDVLHFWSLRRSQELLPPRGSVDLHLPAKKDSLLNVHSVIKTCNKHCILLHHTCLAFAIASLRGAWLPIPPDCCVSDEKSIMITTSLQRLLRSYELSRDWSKIKYIYKKIIICPFDILLLLTHLRLFKYISIYAFNSVIFLHSYVIYVDSFE